MLRAGKRRRDGSRDEPTAGYYNHERRRLLENGANSLIALFLATYGAVFLAEIVGDKLLYTTGVLATRYRPMPIVIGATLALAKPSRACHQCSWQR